MLARREYLVFLNLEEFEVWDQVLLQVLELSAVLKSILNLVVIVGAV